MNKPDVVFEVTVSPVQLLHGCAEYHRLQSQGYFGFHLDQNCPDCKRTDDGWEFWGENGHRQGGSPAGDRTGLARRLQYLARKQWRMKDGRVMGNRITKGSLITYLA